MSPRTTTRRAALLAGATLLLAGCSGAATPVLVPNGAPDPAAQSVSANLRDIVAGVTGVLSKLGLGTDAMSKVQSILGSLTGIADKLSSVIPAGLDWRTMASEALNLLPLLSGLLPAGGIAGAVMALLPEIAKLTGFAMSAPLGRAVMSPVQAHEVLRRAATGRL